ncbi:MAG: hypothetical protein ACLQO7_09060 [Candidatus Bathyarchaeia archaeon]
MNREQAVNIIKQIFEQCRFIEGKSLKLLPPKGNDALSNTYQIHVQVNSDALLADCIEGIAGKHNLAVTRKNGYCIVYKPYPNLS